MAIGYTQAPGPSTKFLTDKANDGYNPSLRGITALGNPFFKWTYTAAVPGSIRSTPAVDNAGNIYFASDYCSITCIDSNGITKWKTDIIIPGDIAPLSRSIVTSSPLLCNNGYLYITGCNTSSGNSKLYAFNASTGALVSSYSFGPNNNLELNSSYYLTGACSSPLISDNQIIIGSVDGYVYSFTTYNLLSVNWSTQLGGVTGNSIWSSPAVDDAGNIYINCSDDNLYCLDSGGAIQWSYKIHANTVKSSPVFSRGLIWVYSPDNKLVGISNAGLVIATSPAFTGNLSSISPAVGPSGNLYVQVSQGASNGLIYAINNTDASFKWTSPYTMISSIGKTQSPTTSALKIGSDDTIYGITDGPHLTAIKDNGTSASQLWTLDFTGADNYMYGSPIIAQDGTIYVTTNNSHVYAITGTITPPCTGLAITSWAMQGQNIYHTGRNNYQGITSNPAIEWSFDTTLFQPLTEPSIGQDGTLYFGSSDGNLYAVAYTGTTGTTGGTGTILWSYPTSVVQSPPAIGNDGTIFVVSDTATYAFSPTGYTGGTGILKWSDPNATQSGANSAPTIGSNGIVYVGGQNTVYAYMPEGVGGTGSIHWSATVSRNALTSPAIGFNETVYVGTTDEGLVAISFTGGTGDVGGTGTILWNYKDNHTLGYGMPTIGSDGTVYVSSQDEAKVVAFYPTGTSGGTGTVFWSYYLNGRIQFTTPTIGNDGTVYVGSSKNTFYALTYTGATGSTGGTGTVKWSFSSPYLLFTNPATIGGDGTVYVTATGATGGVVYGLTYTGPTGSVGGTGTVLWQYPIDVNTNTTSTTYTVLGQNKTLYVPNNAGVLYALIQSPPPIPTAPTGGATGLASTPWAMVGNDIYHTGRSSYQGVIKNPVAYWNLYVGGHSNSSEAIFGKDGTIYVCSDIGGLYALTYTGSSAATGGTGSMKWEALPFSSISATPALGNDGTIYVGANDGGIFAVSTTGNTGTLLWTYKTGSEITSSPAIGNDGTVYIGGRNSILYAFYPAGTSGGTGVVKWSYENTQMAIAGSPAIGQDGTIYVGSEHGLIAVTFTGPTGSVQGTGTNLWSYNTDTTFNTPSVGSDGTVYVTSGDTSLLYALNPTGTSGGTGILKWSFSLGGNPSSSPTIGSDGTIYVGSGSDTFYAVTYTGPTGYTGGSGTVKWSFKTNTSLFDSPATIGLDGTIYVASQDNKLYALVYTGPSGSTGGTGTVLWQYPTTSPINTAPTIGADGTVYAMSMNGTVYAITTQQSPTGPTGPINNICFLKGTYILTTQGEVLVENLTPQHHVLSHGDIVNGRVAHQYSSSRVKSMIHFTAYNLSQFSRPICFKQGSVGHMTPNRDLYISPLHCLLIGDEMVQAHNVVNGTTIAYDMTCSSAEYYHIVLEKHSVIYSNNMATESCSFVELRHEMFEPNTLETTKSIHVY